MLSPSQHISELVHFIIPIFRDLQFHVRKHYYITQLSHGSRHPVVSEVSPLEEVSIEDEGLFSDFVNAPEVETIAVLTIISWQIF